MREICAGVSFEVALEISEREHAIADSRDDVRGSGWLAVASGEPNAKCKMQNAKNGARPFCILHFAFCIHVRSLPSPLVTNRPFFFTAAGERHSAFLHHADRRRQLGIRVGNDTFDAFVREGEVD